MQVFIIGTPLETAKALDGRRIQKQIVECQQILAALNGAKAWSNHPCVLQYKGHERWLLNYMYCLMGYIQGYMTGCKYRLRCPVCGVFIDAKWIKSL